MPILHLDVEQDTEAWEKLRLGIPTSSEFHKIITPVERKRSSQWETHACDLLAERALLRPVDHYTSEDMLRGKLMEERAVDWYEMHEEIDTQKIGFISSDEFMEDHRGRRWHRYGCSPDRLIGEDGLLEIKCPKPGTQMKYFIKGTADRRYWSQLQGQLFISERQWVDILCWHEEMTQVLVRVERDEPFIKLLASYLAEFNEFMDGVMSKLGEVAARPAPKAALKDMLRASLEPI